MKIVVKFKAISYSTGNKKKFKHTFDTGIEFSETTKKNVFKEILLSKESDPKKISLIEDNMDDLYVTDVYEEALDWVDDRDNTDIIVQYDLSHILDYEVIKVGSWSKKKDEKKQIEAMGDSRIAKGGVFHIPNHNMEAEKVLMFIDTNVADEQLKLDMMSCYQKMYKNISNLGYVKQTKILLSSVNIAYDSSLNTLSKLREHSNRLKNVPKFVWTAAFSQGNMESIDFVKRYMDGGKGLEENHLLLIETFKDRENG